MNLSFGVSKPQTLTDLNGITTDGMVKTFMINEIAQDDDFIIISSANIQPIDQTSIAFV